MHLTLLHKTTQEEAIKKIDRYLNELLAQGYPGIRIIDPEKKWDNNIMRFSLTVQKLFLSLDLEGIIIVTDSEVVGEGDVPGIVLTFFSEERIKEVIKERFNKLFNIS